MLKYQNKPAPLQNRLKTWALRSPRCCMLPGLLKLRPLRTDQQGAGRSALLALGVSNMKRTLRTTSRNSLRDLHCWHTAKVFSADCKMHHVFHLHFKSLKRLYFFPEASCDLPNQSPQNPKNPRILLATIPNLHPSRNFEEGQGA